MDRNVNFACHQISYKFEKILVIQTASIGDVILATPVIEQLHLRFPEARIDFLLKKGTHSLFDGHPFLNEVIVWDKSKNKYLSFFRILKKIRQRRYNLIINIHRFFTSGLTVFLSKAETTVGFDKNPFSWFYTYKVKHEIGSKENFMHETMRNLLLIRELAGQGQMRPRLYPTESDYEAVRSYGGTEFITISPASIWFTKQFPKDQWVKFIKAVDCNYSIYLIGGKDDRQLCDEIINESGKTRIQNLAGKLTFLQSLALMKDAAMNYVNDSAPMHLASAINAPVTVVFCSTVPYFGFGPLSERSFIVETGENLACRPCGLHGRKACPEKHFKCALTIDTEQLIQTLKAK
ncbi:MAG: glycosyltransferase family 9 protein [Bacteroidales bacterium]|jgi:heptosyltransferase-2|nr:glycosyltransferase family 9 protein [Bacteroidales bacterium]